MNFESPNSCLILQPQLYYFRFIQKFILIFFLSVFLSCTKILEPQVKAFYLSDIKINSNADVEALIIIKIHNPNNFNIDITIKNLRHYVDEELLGYLLKEKKIILKKKDNTIFNLKVVFKKNIFLGSIFSLLMNENIEIKFQGEIVVNHWSGNYDIALDKTFPINIKTLLGK